MSMFAPRPSHIQTHAGAHIHTYIHTYKHIHTYTHTEANSHADALTTIHIQIHLHTYNIRTKAQSCNTGAGLVNMIQIEEHQAVGLHRVDDIFDQRLTVT